MCLLLVTSWPSCRRLADFFSGGGSWEWLLSEESLCCLLGADYGCLVFLIYGFWWAFGLYLVGVAPRVSRLFLLLCLLLVIVIWESVPGAGWFGGGMECVFDVASFFLVFLYRVLSLILFSLGVGCFICGSVYWCWSYDYGVFIYMGRPYGCFSSAGGNNLK